MMPEYKCPFCKMSFAEFEPAKTHLKDAHPHINDLIASATARIASLMLEDMRQAELAGIKPEEARKAEMRANLNDGEYMLVPFNKLTDEEFRLLLPGYPEVWADGDLESWVIRLPEAKQKLNRFGIPTIRFGVF